MTLTHWILAASLLMPVSLWAHGEDKPGPNGGHIQMPGSFHTELEMDSEQGAHIYLLDLNFQNPTVKDSSVTAYFKGKTGKIPFQCSVMGGDHFHCKPGKKLPAKGDLVIKAVREKAQGNEAVYHLPLKPFQQASQPTGTDHSHHH